MAFDAPTCVEDEHHQTFTFRIEVRMCRDMRFLIGGCLIRCLALLHGGVWDIPEVIRSPFLRLSREFDRFDDAVWRLRSDYGASSGDEVFRCVHLPVFAPPGGGASATK